MELFCVTPAAAQVPARAMSASSRARSTTRAMRTSADAASDAEPSISNPGVTMAAIAATAVDADGASPMCGHGFADLHGDGLPPAAGQQRESDPPGRGSCAHGTSRCIVADADEIFVSAPKQQLAIERSDGLRVKLPIRVGDAIGIEGRSGGRRCRRSSPLQRARRRPSGRRAD